MGMSRDCFEEYLCATTGKPISQCGCHNPDMGQIQEMENRDGRLLQTCLLYTSNEMVEDLIQDLFLKLYQKKIILEDNTKLRSFLFRALKNLIYNQLLRNAKLQSLPDYDFAFDLDYTIDEQLSWMHDQGLSDEVHHLSLIHI